MLSPRDIAEECFSDRGVPEDWQDHWPSIQECVEEIVYGMYIKVPGLDPFDPSEERDELLSDSLYLAMQIFEEKKREREAAADAEADAEEDTLD